MRKGCLIALLWLMALAVGCSRAPLPDARLVRADSLMLARPDSALAIVEGIDPAALTGDGDRAYRELLLAQARYRCYITATTDSGINRALHYYTRHSDDRDKLTRAHLYKGAVMEELGHPDSAMRHYKAAEAAAAPNDHFNLGYANLRIAELYQFVYDNDAAVIFRLRRADHYFTLSKDTAYLISTAGKIGAFPGIIGRDSSEFYLKRAIQLAKSINSPKGLQYQSKLAGLYFYDGDYARAKGLAMEIINSDWQQCNEYQFFYYAARSFIKLSKIDSALWVKSIIPQPVTAVDSMNEYILESELAELVNDYKSISRFKAKADSVQKKILRGAINSNLSTEEAKMDADMQKKALTKDYHLRSVLIIIICVALILLIVVLARIKIKAGIRRMEHDMELLNLEFQNEITSYRNKINQLEIIGKEQSRAIKEEREELRKAHNLNAELLSKEANIHIQVSNAIQLRESALRELYQGIKVKAGEINSPHSKRTMPLLGLIQELNEKKQLASIEPKNSFWEKLKQSVDIEYQGIATFVEENYPQLTLKDRRLFLLLCAGLSPQIIKLCLGYSHVVTVSNYKKKLMKEKIGMDVRLEDFVRRFLEGQMTDSRPDKLSD